LHKDRTLKVGFSPELRELRLDPVHRRRRCDAAANPERAGAHCLLLRKRQETEKLQREKESHAKPPSAYWKF
jgi:hypothetical protein